MLGKRCRTIHRTASISQNMGPHYLHHHNYHQAHDLTDTAGRAANPLVVGHPNPPTVNPQAPAEFPQIIGFNPMIKSDASGVGTDQSPQPKLCWAPTPNPDSPLPPNDLSARPHPHDMYDDEPKHDNKGARVAPSTKRSQFAPRSALQTLLAAARQIACADQSASAGKSVVEAAKSSFKVSNSITGPSCVNNNTISAAKQGSLIWQGIKLSEATPKEVPSNKHSTTPKASMPVSHTQGASHDYSQNVSMTEAPEYQEVVHMNEVDSENIFDVEGSSHTMGACVNHPVGLESVQEHHALYLATSPLDAEFTPNLGASMSFLESCHLCKRPLGQGRDIFMYRGETAFCSVECRDKQMSLEERKEKLRYVHSQINKLNVRKTDVLCGNTGMGSTNPTSYYQPHNHHHPQQYSSQAVAYNDKQHRASLLMPAA